MLKVKSQHKKGLLEGEVSGSCGVSIVYTYKLAVIPHDKHAPGGRCFCTYLLEMQSK